MAEKKKVAAKAPVKKKTASHEQPAATVEAVPHKPHPVVHHRQPKEKQPAGPKYYGTGRRKEATARVWLRPGSGKVMVNGHSYNEYFCNRKILEVQVIKPLNVTNTLSNYDVMAEAFGGGVPAQAGAVSLGIARALLEVSPDFRLKLKREGLLTRDPRTKERKKYGLKRARRAFQYTKR